MRDTPTYISKAVKRYDATLSVKWLPESERWFLIQGDKTLFPLHHLDGTPVMELFESEVLAILSKTKADSAGKILMDGRKVRQARLDYDRKEKMDAQKATQAEVASRTEAWRRGSPKPFIETQRTRK